MKIKSFIFAGLVLVAGISVLSSCNKIKEVAKVNVGVNSSDVSFTIDPLPAGTATLAEFNTYVNVDSIIKAANDKVGIGNIRNVKIVSFNMVIENGDANNNFAALQSCKAELSSDAKPEKITVAEVTDNPDVEAYELNMPAKSDVELKDYFGSTHFSYRITGTLRKPITKALNVKATVRYELEAGL